VWLRYVGNKSFDDSMFFEMIVSYLHPLSLMDATNK